MKDNADEKAQTLCYELLRSETEDEVISILKKEGFWEDRRVWQPYGNIGNNRGIVGNQQSSAVAALVEKIINSIDAVLTAECLIDGIDPTSSDAPSTMREAVERFFGVRDGRIEILTPKERTVLAENIQLVACGTKEHPCYLIIDDGEGQQPEDFPNTFLSLLRENKTKIPFVQGKFNMGGTGVLQFSGYNSFQLIISRRQPEIPSAGRPTTQIYRWGFTLVRRMDPSTDQPQSTYVYLAPNNKILSFESESMNVKPGRHPDLYVNAMEAGTCIKIWNYKLPGRLKTIATLDLRYALEKYLQDPALPIRVYERRNYRANYYDTTVSGLACVLSDNRQDIEPGMDSGGPLEVPEVGTIHMRVVVVRDNPENQGEDKRYPPGIFFIVNGQLHSMLESDFISRRTKLDYISDSLIVMVDCTSIPTRVREDIFLASRDRMRYCSERTLLENAIVDYLKDHPGLRALNALRRQKRLTSSLSDVETKKILQALVKSDPTIAKLFGKGQQIKIPSGNIPEPESYVGRQYPTIFRLLKEPAGGLIKKCPINHTCRIEYETDATNDYFSRANEHGRVEIQGASTLLSVHLWNGKASLRFAHPTASNIGDQLNVHISVTDPSRNKPFDSKFIMEIGPETPMSPSGGEPKPPSSALTNIPSIKEIRRDQWEMVGFDESSAIKIMRGEEDTLDIYINMDNIYLRNEIAKRRNTDPVLLNYWFKWGLCLLALGMIYQQRQRSQTDIGSSTEENSEIINEEDRNKISDACEGLAVTIIPVISQISRPEQEELAKSDEK